MLSFTTLTAIVFLLTTHYIGDYLLQTRKQANNKHNNLMYLGQHAGTYTLVLFIMLLLGNYFNFASQLEFGNILIYAGMNGLLHFTTDYYTSSAVKKAWEAGREYKTFAIMGLDQLLHIVGLIATLRLLFV